MNTTIKKIALITLLFMSCTVSWSQNFTGGWPFASDSLGTSIGNVTCNAAIINSSLFTRLRSYSSVGLKGMGTAGKTTTPSCSALYNAAGATTPISPYMELVCSPNTGYSANIDAFSFKLTADSLSSASMLFSAGYSIDGGITFTGFSISKNGFADTVKGTTGSTMTTGDTFRISAPALSIPVTGSLIIRIIYWKNATGATTSNRIIISPILLSGTTTPGVASPVINNPAPTSITGLSYIEGSGPSTSSNFTVSANYLTSNFIVKAPTNFELSLNGTSFSDSLILVPVSGSVSSTQVYARLKVGLTTGSYIDSIRLYSTGANSKSVVCLGTVVSATAPLLSIPTPSNIQNLNYFVGFGPSVAQSFVISGRNLTDSVKLTVSSAFYEISLTHDTGYINSTTGPLVIPPSGNPWALNNTTIYVRLRAGNTASTTRYLNKTVVVSSIGATSVTDTLNGIIYTPTIFNTPNTLTGFNYLINNGPSASQSFTASAIGPNPLGIKAPANYEISTNASAGFTDSINVAVTLPDSVINTQIFVRLKSGLPLGTYNQNIVLSSNGAISKNISCAGTVTSNLPTITTNVNSLSGFVYQLGNGPSTQRVLTVSGINLTQNVLIKAPAHFEISDTSGSRYADSLSYPVSNNTLAATPVYIRLKAGLNTGSYNDSMVISSTGIAQNFVLNGNVVDFTQPSNVTSYTETFDSSTSTLGSAGTSYYNSTFITVPNWGNWTRSNVGSTSTMGMLIPDSLIRKCPKFRASTNGTYIQTPRLKGVNTISCSVAENTANVTDTLTISDGGTLNNSFIYTTTSASTTTIPNFITLPVPVSPSASSIDSFRFTLGNTSSTHYIDNLTFTFNKPTTQDTGLVLTKSGNSMNLSWNRPNGGNNNQGNIVFVGTGVFTPPTSGVSYKADSTYGLGTALGNYYCVYNGQNSNVNVVGLDSTIIYQVFVMEYNGIQGQSDENYNTTQMATNECENNYWNGTVSTEWENPANWACGIVPSVNTNVFIESGKLNYPVIHSMAYCKSLHVSPNATFTVSTGYHLEITGHN